MVLKLAHHGERHVTGIVSRPQNSAVQVSILHKATAVCTSVDHGCECCSKTPDDLVLAHFEWHGIGKQRTHPNVCRLRATESPKKKCLRDGAYAHVSQVVGKCGRRAHHGCGLVSEAEAAKAPRTQSTPNASEKSCTRPHSCSVSLLVHCVQSKAEVHAHRKRQTLGFKSTTRSRKRTTQT